MEPIEGSGERIVIATAVRQYNTVRIQAIPALSFAQIECLIGKTAAPALNSLIDHTVNSISQCAVESLDAWQPPFSSIIPGLTAELFVDNIEEAFDVAFRNSSSLWKGFSDQTRELQQSSKADNWRKEIIKGIKDKAPRLDAFFEKEIRVSRKARPTTIDYSGISLVANFGQLLPGRGLTRHVNTAKAKLWDLTEAREGTLENNLANSGSMPAFELLVYRPPKGDQTFTERELKLIDEASEELEYSGDKKEMRVRTMHTATQAVSHIIKLEKAALG